MLILNFIMSIMQRVIIRGALLQQDQTLTNYCLGDWSLVCQLSKLFTLGTVRLADGGDFYLSTLITQTFGLAHLGSYITYNYNYTNIYITC